MRSPTPTLQQPHLHQASSTTSTTIIFPNPAQTPSNSFHFLGQLQPPHPVPFNPYTHSTQHPETNRSPPLILQILNTRNSHKLQPLPFAPYIIDSCHQTYLIHLSSHTPNSPYILSTSYILYSDFSPLFLYLPLTQLRHHGLPKTQLSPFYSSMRMYITHTINPQHFPTH